jgi:hypothetical protein
MVVAGRKVEGYNQGVAGKVRAGDGVAEEEGGGSKGRKR